MCQCVTDAFRKGHVKSDTLPYEAFRGRNQLEQFEIILDTALA